MSPTRRIGPFGTGARGAAGLALLVLGLLDKPAGLIGGFELHELLLGLVAFPAATVALGLLARHYVEGPLRFTGATGIVVNCGVIVALFAIPYTTGAAALFYGTTLLVGAWRSQPDCEVTVLSNLILARSDQIGCPVFMPIDAMEARHAPSRHA